MCYYCSSSSADIDTVSEYIGDLFTVIKYWATDY